MFTRVKTVRASGRTYQYLQLVENHRDKGQVRQRLIASLGRLDQLLDKGDLEQVVKGLVRYLPQLRLIEAQRQHCLVAETDRIWGPVLVFERLWQELGLHGLFQKLDARRRLGFDLDRCAFAIVLQRLLAPGSDLRGSKWIKTVEAEGFEQLQLSHFYKTLGVLWREKETIEQHLYKRGLDLFNQEVELVFFDTTSTYFEGTRWEGWAKRGMSRDHRPDHLQLILGVVMRRDGIPISCEIWPGNTADVTTLVPILETLKKRFRIRRVVLVCDRGMVSAANLKAIAQAGYDYIVGMRMRRNLEVREDVLRRAGRYREVKRNLHVKEVWVDERRYIVCFNPERAEKDQQDRQAILEKLGKKLGRGSVKGLIGNVGYRRFLKAAKGSVEIDPKRVKDDERYDGKYVLRTSTELPAAEVAEAYRQLTWIERLWRELKDVVQLRPIYHHHKKDNVKGHIFAAFLALYLSAMLRRRLDELWQREHPDEPPAEPTRPQPAKTRWPWDDLIRDLSQLRGLRVRLDGELYLLRTELKGTADRAFRAVGLRPPPLAEKLSRLGSVVVKRPPVPPSH